ncbi:hypothetical protein Pelo_17143 [Pelomyxa schiedti]|nr:hypothetical protein Pelo_17143 [Pelomyxa schiedti]
MSLHTQEAPGSMGMGNAKTPARNQGKEATIRICSPDQEIAQNDVAVKSDLFLEFVSHSPVISPHRLAAIAPRFLNEYVRRYWMVSGTSLQVRGFLYLKGIDCHCLYLNPRQPLQQMEYKVDGMKLTLFDSSQETCNRE